MRILVTGGAGFVGSHLCERLSKNKNNSVYSLDNYFTGSLKNHVENVNYIKANTSDIASVIGFTPDIIFHLGEYSRVEQSFEDVSRVMEYNIQGTYQVLEFVRKTKAKLVYAGSSTKFGDNGLGRNESPYAWSKASNTELIINYKKWFNINYAITYFYNVYGEREISSGKYATLIALFVQKMKNNESLTVVKPGIQKRNFTHIDDIIDGLELVGEKGEGDGFGIGNPQSFSVLEIARAFGGDIKYLEERKGNRLDASIDISKTQKLGWKPQKNVLDYINDLKKNAWHDKCYKRI